MKKSALYIFLLALLFVLAVGVIGLLVSRAYETDKYFEENPEIIEVVR